MKIKRIIAKPNKLFSLKLLKTKIYTEKKLNTIKIKMLKLSFKKAFHIIYKFHIMNKKILFVGTPIKENKQIKQLLKNTTHTFLPKSVWIDGAISNSSSIIKHLFKRHKLKNLSKKKSTVLFRLNRKYDLIVILNNSLNKTALKESLNKRVPIISVNYYLNSLSFNPSTYKILDNFNSDRNKTRNHYFYTILNTIFKKAKKNKKKIIFSKKRRFVPLPL